MVSALSRFDVILLDQGKTFMFENDRFGLQIDYATTYRALGGITLSPARVQRVVNQLFDRLLAIYQDSTRSDSFPTIPDAIRDLPVLGVPEVDWNRFSYV
jgi:hypothetical protein